ncbi:MAG: hypothetical protein MZW92_43515 [Comamonadaceae bacterium]|nr:hypothetical protein [Comamonadaceae bacterium]
MLANVGPLIVPTTMAQYRARSVPLPPGLFSHNDQQSTWMAGPREGARVGYGGLLGDMFAGSNQFQNFTAMSASGTSVFLSGRSTAQMQIGNNGGVQINALNNQTLFGGQNVGNTLRGIMTSDRGNTFEKDYNTINRRAAERGRRAECRTDELPDHRSAIQHVPQHRPRKPAAQHRPHHRRTRAAGRARQVFFASIGGFDQHSGTGQWPRAAVGADLQCDVGVLHGARGSDARIWPTSVTAFTASDFGRTLDSNGQRLRPRLGFAPRSSWVARCAATRPTAPGPTPCCAAPNDVGRGNLLPTTSVEQYAGTLAKWFGVPDSDMANVVPRAGNWSSLDLGFMNAA